MVIIVFTVALIARPGSAARESHQCRQDDNIRKESVLTTDGKQSEANNSIAGLHIFVDSSKVNVTRSSQTSFLDTSPKIKKTNGQIFDPSLLFQGNGEDNSGPGPAIPAFLAGSKPRQRTSFRTVRGTRSAWTYLKLLGDGDFGEIWSAVQERPPLIDELFRNRRTQESEFTASLSGGQEFDRYELLNPSQLTRLDLPHPDAAITIFSDEEEKKDLEIWDEVVYMKKLIGSQYVVQMLDNFQDNDGLCYVVMEYVAGGHLTDNVPKEGLDATVARKFFVDIIEGLDFMHKNGLAHCNIEPDNVLITPDGRAKLCNFGSTSEITYRKTYYSGTEGYAAPEIIDAAEGEGEGYDGPEVDVFALGATLFFMVTGSKPFQSDAEVKLGYPQHKHKRLLEEKLVSEEIKTIIERMMEDCETRAKIPAIKEMPWVKDIPAASHSWVVRSSSGVIPTTCTCYVDRSEIPPVASSANASGTENVRGTERVPLKVGAQAPRFNFLLDPMFLSVVACLVAMLLIIWWFESIPASFLVLYAWVVSS